MAEDARLHGWLRRAPRRPHLRPRAAHLTHHRSAFRAEFFIRKFRTQNLDTKSIFRLCRPQAGVGGVQPGGRGAHPQQEQRAAQLRPQYVGLAWGVYTIVIKSAIPSIENKRCHCSIEQDSSFMLCTTGARRRSCSVARRIAAKAAPGTCVWQANRARLVYHAMPERNCVAPAFRCSSLRTGSLDTGNAQ